MQNRTIIIDLKSLQAAKAELQAEQAAREVNIRYQYAELKDSFFNFSELKHGGSRLIKNFLGDKFGMITAALSGFIVNKIIRPKNKWFRKISTAGVSFFVKKYSGIIEKKIKSLLQN